MLSLAGVSKRYAEIVALEDVSLEVGQGEVLGLLGPNGAGKTTLVSILAGLRKPDRGTVRLGGVDVVAQPQAAQRLLGLAPQALGVYMVLTVAQNLRTFAQLRGLRGEALAEAIDEVVGPLALEPLLQRRVSTLSGGQQRRLHTAIALLGSPPVVLLDEPTAGADVESRSALLELVRRLARDGTTVCYSTHYLQEVEALDPTVVFLRKGRVVAGGTVAELTARAGGSFIELRFDGPAPQLALAAGGQREGSSLRVPADRPAEKAGELIAALGEDARRLRAVEVFRPNLETAYLALTGASRTPDQEPV